MTSRRIVILVVALIVLIPIALLAAAILVVQSEWGERWVERQVSARIHRDVQVNDIEVKLQWPPAFTFGKVRIANPSWASTPALVDAQGLYAQVLFLPLFEKRVVIPYLGARSAEAGLEMQGDKATWRFDSEQKEPSRLELARVVLEDGHIVYRNANENSDIDARMKGSTGEEGELTLQAKGKFRGQPTQVSARLPGINAMHAKPIRFEGEATIGNTHARAEGVVGGDMETYDLNMKVKGKTLKELDWLTGVVLPETPAYNLEGHLKHAGDEWTFDPFAGKVGDSDLEGNALFRKASPRPFLKADLRSKLLDFKDLGPLVGTPPKKGQPMNAKQKAKSEEIQVSDKVLPHEPFNTEHWDDMDADVKLTATRVVRPQTLPIESLKTHLVMKDGVIHLDPLDFGYAGGKIKSDVTLDGHAKPIQAKFKGDVQNVKLARMFPTMKSMDEALGNLYGRVDLTGRGDSIADMLGTSSGKVVVAANGGQVSELLTKLLEIDVAHAAMLLGTRDKQVELRCAVGHLDVKDGVAKPESFIVDTTKTFVQVGGDINLKDERLDIVTQGKGKSPSLLTLKTPVVMEGPLKKPKVHPKGGPLLAQAGAAVALGALNPALAIAPFVSKGDAKDANCDQLLAEARNEGAAKKSG